jgi:HK97 family phage prohead protease
MDFPADLFVAPVPGHDDLVKFQYDFVLEGKAVADSDLTQTVTVEENGDLIIEGYAAVFDGMDRQNENFTDGAFKRGIKSFLEGQAGLCYHHKHDKLLGKVLDLREEEGKGLKMRARVDGAIRKHPELGTYYEQIKNGSLNALSVGGFFRRKLTEAGKKIVDMDFTEISVTPVPVHPGTNFAVVAGKALTSDLRVPENVNVDLPDGEIRDEDFESLQYALELLGRIHKNVGGRAENNTSTD